MAEWLRRLGDVGLSDLEGPMAVFLKELQTEGTVTTIALKECTPPDRWILTEEAALYQTAFAADHAGAAETQAAARSILRRYLETHALVGLHEILTRYPLEKGWAQMQLEEWTRSGRLVSVTTAESEPLQWSAAESFEQMQRGTLSILRREVVPCPASQYADFLMRWQGLSGQIGQPESADLATVLGRLEACALPGELWEQAILPALPQLSAAPAG